MEVSIPTTDRLRYKLDTIFNSGSVTHNRGESNQETWSEVKLLGEGAQGTVHLETRDTPTPQLRAVKKISQRWMKANNIGVEREMHALMAVMEYEHLFVRFLGWYEDPAAQFVYLAMEHVPHGDLGQFMTSNGPEAKRQVQCITKQLLEAIAILHGKQICHRDLKPQNVLVASIEPVQVKLADFGVSKHTGGAALETRLGSSGYMAPELLGILPQGMRRTKGYTTAVDLWALGCLIHEILTGETPFVDRSVESEVSGVATAVRCGPLPTDTHQLSEYCNGTRKLPTEALRAAQTASRGVKFVKRLLIADPRLRPSAADMLDDPWITVAGGAPTQLTACVPVKRVRSERPRTKDFLAALFAPDQTLATGRDKKDRKSSEKTQRTGIKKIRPPSNNTSSLNQKAPRVALTKLRLATETTPDALLSLSHYRPALEGTEMAYILRTPGARSSVRSSPPPNQHSANTASLKQRSRNSSNSTAVAARTPEARSWLVTIRQAMEIIAFITQLLRITRLVTRSNPGRKPEGLFAQLSRFVRLFSEETKEEVAEDT